MSVQSFKDLDVWQVGMKLAESCYRVTRSFPKEELYGLTSQIRRAAVSIPANIAEGYGRELTGSFIQFLRIAQGSSRELETHLLLSARLVLFPDTSSAQLQSECERVEQRCSGHSSDPLKHAGRHPNKRPLRPHAYSRLTLTPGLPPMLAFIARRLLLAVVTMWAITVLSFIIIQLPPGDFVDAYIARLSASGSSVSAAEAENLRKLYGLDQPYAVQYAKWMGRILKGDFGESMEWQRPVAEVLGDRLWMTVSSHSPRCCSPGVWRCRSASIRPSGSTRSATTLITTLGFIGLAVPNFLLALIILYLAFRWFGANVGGLFSAEMELAPWGWAKVVDLIWHLPLPALILAIAGTAQLIRIMRANLLDELRKPYVVTARAKGLTEMRVILKYPVRAALNPFASTLAYLFPYLVSGSIIISLVMSLPTVGPVLLSALIAQDMYLAGTIVLLLGALTVVGTFISDLVLMWIDPRIRHQVDQQ